MKIKDLPKGEKPRERLIKYGANNLSNEDLLSIIFRCGTKNYNVRELSNILLNKINNINDLAGLSFEELIEIKGIGSTKAITLLASIELGKRVSSKVIEDKILINNTKTIHDYFSNIISSSNQEELLLILLDNKKRLINYNIMYKGTSDSSLVSPSEIFNYAIKNKARAIVIMHNHPSGVINPSAADINLTNNLINTGKIIGIPLLDHIITNGNSYYSFFDEMIKNEV